MSHSIAEIAAALGAVAHGEVSIKVTGAAEPASAAPDQLALAMSPAYAPGLAEGRARAAIVWPGADWRALGLLAAIEAPRARLALARLTAMLDDGPDIAPGVHPTAVIDPTAVLGAEVSVGPLTVIGAGAQIGAGTRIAGQVTIASGARIGPDGLIGPGVRVCRNVAIGARVVIQPNAVIGGDGFSFVTETPSNAERARSQLGGEMTPPEGDPRWHRIHSLGGVVIGDDVEIGALAAVDAGTIRPTRVGDGCKLDNHVQIGHNVTLGRHCLLAGQSAVAGSSVLGDRVVLGGKAGVVDNIRVGDDVVLAAGALALSNVPAGRVMMGSPAVRMETHIESYKALRRLPRLLRDLTLRQKSVSKPGESD
ncbi:MAG: UDP-3-O-(3-hydroxymyristoyl)glucosamine N-acyltransferase [Limimaricola sp.]|uniref:UDP-3-O-(3-hydroxymyristoyl)glucosamine N-acyltransferase n=1 Tax=Limimaricola sp. TaxID=2211665 RepID=UPI001DDFDC59|nr:UDP-3-O-(3-hydroxymyristoyl)glucosamine N-acyltransferase [Limimaricola sp.]MBI1418221.1 UDP-3-O-(3-hydroxymyristoyl)glucosamine N-acyltransferase [Limimaricola sp.]